MQAKPQCFIDLPISRSAAFPSTPDRVSFAFPEDISLYLEKSPYSLYEVATCSVAVLMHRFTLQNKIFILTKSEEVGSRVHSISLTDETTTRHLMALFSLNERAVGVQRNVRPEVAVMVNGQSYFTELTDENSLPYNQMIGSLIDFNFVKGKNGFSIEVAFSRACISLSLVKEMIGCLFTLFEDVCCLDNMLVNKIRLISPIKMMDLKTRRTHDAHFFYFPVSRMFNEIVAERQDNLALTDEKGDCCTYRELMDESNQVANYILRKNPKKKLVGIVELSTKLTVLASLACIRGGIEFILIPKDYLPQAISANRLEYCVGDVSLMLDTVCWIHEKSPYLQESIVLVNPAVIQDESTILAYVYSSRRLGEPCCFPLTHRAFFDQFAALHSTDRAASTAVVLSLIESSSVLNLVHSIATLLSGAHFLLTRYNATQNLNQILTLIAGGSVTHLHVTSGQLLRLIRFGLVDKCESLRCVFSHRGALPSTETLQLAEKLELYNVYSLSELGGAISYCRCISNASMLKHPISGVGSQFEFLVLDEAKRLLPRGALGYLYLNLSPNYSKHLLKSPHTSNKLVEVEILGKKQLLLKTGDTARSLDSKYLMLGCHETLLSRCGNFFPVDQQLVAHKMLELLPAHKVCLISYRDKIGTNRIVAFIVPPRLDPNYYLFNSVDVIKSLFPRAWFPKILVLVDDLIYKPCGRVDEKTLLASFSAGQYPHYVQFGF